nr:MAG TPA: hypothetical protein [Caudoviricetes sp.]
MVRENERMYNNEISVSVIGVYICTEVVCAY